MTPMQQDQQHQPKPPPPAAPAGAAPKLNPRLQGALLLALGFVLEGFNGFMLVDDNTYYPKLLLVGAVLMPLGGWTLVTGIAWDKNAAVKPPAWWTAGAVVLCLIGVVLGVGAIYLLST